MSDINPGLRVGGLYIARGRNQQPLSSYDARGKLVEIAPDKCAVYLGTSALGNGRGRRWLQFLFEEKVVSWCCPDARGNENEWWIGTGKDW